MKIRSIASLLLLVTWLLPPQLVSQAEATSWIPVDTGIDYQEFHVSGPNNVFVTRMDRHNPYVTLETSLAKGRFGTREVITSQAARYDQSINYWTGEWGARSRVVAAINGSYQNDQTIFPDRGVVQSGWYAKRFSDNQTGSGFGLKLDGTAFIGGCVSHPLGKQVVTFSNSETQPITDINAPRGENQLILYTPQYNSNTLTSDSGLEVVVQMDTPTLIRSTPANASGHVVEIRANQGSTPIPFDAVVLSASHSNDPGTGDAANFLRNHVEVGDVIGVSQTIRNKEESNCSIEDPDVDWTETYTSLGGDFHFLNKGTIQPYSTNAGATARAPRTAVAFDNDYIYFIVVDGRNPGVSVGMSMAELGKFAKSQLGAVEGIAEDGGGSSVMVVNGVVRNFPSDGLPRPPVQPQQPIVIANQQSIYLPVINRGQQQFEPLPLPPPPTPPYPIVERAVVDGFMMVVVEPKELSTAFAPGNRVVTTADPAFVRLGPGTNYAVLNTVSLGTIGTVIEHNLAGVLAKNTHWWKVDYGNGNQGWVPEEALSLLPAQ